MWIKIKRVVRAGFFSFWRNGFVSLSSILVMVATLFVIGSVIFSGVILRYTLDQIKNKVDINVYFVSTASEQDILAMKDKLEKLAEVQPPVTYVSRDQALAEFRQRNQNDHLILQSLDELGENPLGAKLNIKAKDPSQYEGIANFLQNQSALSVGSSSIIDKVNYKPLE